MNKKMIISAAICVIMLGALLITSQSIARGRGDGPIIYVTSQGLYYDSIVTADPLPPKGPFQLLEMGPNGLQTEFGPGDTSYVGGRWWMDTNGNGEMDESDHYFSCPLLGPGRGEPSGLAVNNAFVHGIILNVDGTDYYLAGAPDGPDGATDIPGHYWVQAGKERLIGKHYNIGPLGAEQWWSSNAADAELLYIVYGIIDTWSEEKSAEYVAKGFIHYHELVSVSDGTLHPEKVLWLKHIARTSFTLDGGPHPEFTHDVTPGVDYEFIPNFHVPYP